MESPFVLVLFGATGDLAKNKLIPSLFTLFTKKELPKDFFIFGLARRDMTDSEFGAFFPELSSNPAWNEFATHLHYQQGLFDEEKGYLELVEKLASLDKKLGACITRIFYLATPPNNYDAILQMIVNTKISESGPSFAKATEGQARIAIEKPFGKD